MFNAKIRPWCGVRANIHRILKKLQQRSKERPFHTSAGFQDCPSSARFSLQTNNTSTVRYACLYLSILHHMMWVSKYINATFLCSWNIILNCHAYSKLLIKSSKNFFLQVVTVCTLVYNKNINYSVPEAV